MTAAPVHGRLLLDELLYTIRTAIADQPRSQQTRIGPSELGIGDVTKWCYACGQTKPLSEFYRDRSRKDGRTNRCQVCDLAKAQARYATDPSPWRARYAVDREKLLDRKRMIRDRAIAIYGGSCVLCGSTEWLEFDHEDGDGNEHRKSESHHAYYQRIVDQGMPLSDVRLRLLCYSCHRPDVLDAVDRLVRRLVWLVPRVRLTENQRTVLRELARGL